MAARLHVCFLAPEVFAWGRYGSVGRATRVIGRELVRRGVRVSAVVPRQHGQRELEQVDGITVLGYPAQHPWRAAELCRECDADIYHSQNPSLATTLALLARRRRRHVVTIRSVHPLRDRLRELATPPAGRLRALASWLERENPIVRLTVHRVQAAFCAAESLLPVAQARYRRSDLHFLPTPVDVPRRVQKGAVPLVCFLGCWERRCRPEAFFELARRFRRVRFVAVGRPRDRAYEAALRREYGSLPNVRLTGFINPFRSDALAQILSESWVVVSASTGHGLPDACVEGAAHRCAILSTADPDGFASRFGHHAAEGDLAAGLDALLAGDTWRERGICGYEHVRETFEASRAIERHLAVYTEVLEGAIAPSGGEAQGGSPADWGPGALEDPLPASRFPLSD